MPMALQLSGPKVGAEVSAAVGDVTITMQYEVREAVLGDSPLTNQ